MEKLGDDDTVLFSKSPEAMHGTRNLASLRLALRTVYSNGSSECSSLEQSIMLCSPDEEGIDEAVFSCTGPEVNAGLVPKLDHII